MNAAELFVQIVLDTKHIQDSATRLVFIAGMLNGHLGTSYSPEDILKIMKHFIDEWHKAPVVNESTTNHI